MAVALSPPPLSTKHRRQDDLFTPEWDRWISAVYNQATNAVSSTVTITGLVGTGTRFLNVSPTGVVGALTLGAANRIVGVDSTGLLNEYKAMTVTSAGVVTAGTWQGTAIGTIYGGTGLTSYTAGDTLYASATNTLAKLAKGTADQIYGMNTGATIPEWKAVTVTAAGVTTIPAAGSLTVASTTESQFTGADLRVTRANTGAAVQISAYNTSGTNVLSAATLYANSTTGHARLRLESSANGTNYYDIQGYGDDGLYFLKGGVEFLSYTGTTLAATGLFTVSSRAAFGGAINAAFGVNITGSTMTGAEQTGLRVDVTSTNAATTYGRGLYVRWNTAAASYTVPDLNVIEIATPSIGAGSAATRVRGLYINTMNVAATTNIGISIEDVSGGSFNYSIYTGAGDVRLGSLTAATTRLVTATSDGVLGNATTIAGAYTLSGVITFSSQPIISTLTASLPVFTDGSKGLVSNAMTGTGNVMMSASPTTTGTLTGAAANWSGDQTLSYANSGAKVLSTIKNTSDTASSHAELLISNAGSSGGNAYVRFLDNTVNLFFGAVLGGSFEFNRQGTSGGTGVFNIDSSRNLLFAPVNGSGSLFQFAYSLNSAPTTEYPFIAATNNGGSAPFNSRGHLIIGGRNSSANQDIYVYTSVAGTLTKTFTFSGGNSTSNGTLTVTGVLTASSTSTFTGVATHNGGITMAAGVNAVLATSTGTKWGTGTNQLQAWWNATPVDQPAHIADPTGGVVIDAESRTAIAAINAMLAETGLTAAS